MLTILGRLAARCLGRIWAVFLKTYMYLLYIKGISIVF